MSNPTSHFIAAVLLVIAAAALGQNRDMPPGAQHKSLWTLDLRSSALARERNLYKSPISMSFVDSDTLAVAWFVSQPQRNVYVDAPATLKAVYIDASTGRERSKAQWAASSRPLQVEITSSGKLLVPNWPECSVVFGRTHRTSPETVCNAKAFSLSCVTGR